MITLNIQENIEILFLMNKMNCNKKTIVVILGMHRSGTSCLARSLESYGLYLGNVKTSSPYNKKGNRENPDIFNFHERVFNDNGGSWHNPPRKIEWTDVLSEDLECLISSYDKYSQWGFKDPRSVFFMEHWIVQLSDRFQFKFVASYRNPTSVALSLNKRNQFTPEKGMAIWLQYNLKLLSLCNRYSVELINFDSEKHQYMERLQHIAKNLGLNDLAAEDTFYQSSYLNSNARMKACPAEIIDVYKLLNNHASS